MPKHFETRDRALLHNLIRRFNFATLVTSQDGRPFASHLPFVLEADRGEHGTLVAHMSRANEQWRVFDGQVEALVIFQGDHAYISPSWYETHPSVPTWNYMVVHAYGVPHVVVDEDRVREMLRTLVDQQEAGFAMPWTMDLPEAYLRTMIRGIVAVELPIARLEGKFKLSQNRSARDRELVAAMLASGGDPLGHGVAAAMHEQR